MLRVVLIPLELRLLWLGLVLLWIHQEWVVWNHWRLLVHLLGWHWLLLSQDLVHVAVEFGGLQHLLHGLRLGRDVNVLVEVEGKLILCWLGALCNVFLCHVLHLLLLELNWVNLQLLDALLKLLIEWVDLSDCSLSSVVPDYYYSWHL